MDNIKIEVAGEDNKSIEWDGSINSRLKISFGNTESYNIPTHIFKEAIKDVYEKYSEIHGIHSQNR